MGDGFEVYFSVHLVDHYLVDVAPLPLLTWLEALDDWVSAAVVVFRGVLADRVVATSHVTTAHAKPQVNPPHSGLQALLAPVGSHRRNVPDLIQMHAGRHWTLPPSVNGAATRDIR